ncbi:MAG: HAMP domain-containing protein [Deltaproteobacteria bacterium]|nr:HAMP domain-containing protein [Deltaproteobacteria bacterium]
MSSLRVRLTLVLMAVVLFSVGVATVVYLREVSARLVADQQARSATAERLVHADLLRLQQRLDREVGHVLDPRGVAATLSSRGSAAERWTWAASRLEPGRVDVLSVLGDQGEVLTSGHWPASLGARDPAIAQMSGLQGDEPTLLMQAVPSGSVPAFVRWGTGRWGSQQVTAVAGRIMDSTAIEGLRAVAGADLLAVCPPSAPCVVTVAEGVQEPSSTFDPDDAAWTRALRLGSPYPGLWLGVDRSALQTLRRRVRLRALVVALAGALLAMGIGLVLSRRIARPVEALARAADEVAAGDFHAAGRVPASDIAEVQRLVSAFAEMGGHIERSRDELVRAERVAAWQEIARGLAHELKNPLTPIQASMDVIRRARRLDRADFDEILDEQAGAVVEEVQRLKELADSFSRFARLPDPRPEALDPRALLDGVVSLYATKNVEVRRTYPEDDPGLVADRTQLHTALSNLVKNAIEAAEETDRPPTLHLTIVASDPLLIAIEDSGPGVAPELQDRLFTPYVTTKGSRGTGLGLALVHRIAVEHRGSISVGRSERLAGARFELRLPLGRQGS